MIYCDNCKNPLNENEQCETCMNYENPIIVVEKKVGKPPQARVIEHTLENLQSAVDGYIDIVSFARLEGESIDIVVDDEGLLKGSEYNFSIAPEVHLFGDVLFTKTRHSDGETVSLSMGQAISIIKAWEKQNGKGEENE